MVGVLVGPQSDGADPEATSLRAVGMAELPMAVFMGCGQIMFTLLDLLLSFLSTNDYKR